LYIRLIYLRYAYMNTIVSDEARLLTYGVAERLQYFRSLSVPEQSAVFAELSNHVKQIILKQLQKEEIVNLIDNMDMQQAKRVLVLLPDTKLRQAVVRRLKSDVREKVDFFLRFHPQANLSLVNFNYVFLPSTQTISTAATLIDEHYSETGKYPEVLIHEKGRVIGEVPFAALVRERNTSTLKRYVQPIPTISYHADIPEIIDVVTQTESKKVIVLDQDESVLGIIYSDSVRPLFGKLAASTLYEFTGVDESERPFDSVHKKVSNRARWLILNLVTCFLAGSVILLFQDTLDALTILTVYIPIVAGMGGNVAAQSFAVMVRGITLGTVSLKTAGPVLRREAIAGLLNGIIIGSIVALISAVWNKQPLLGLVVGIALICAHVVAAVSGALIPLIMKKLGKDPAATSSIFITTVTDVVGLLLLFGIASIVLL
jgi:magnesium transporter